MCGHLQIGDFKKIFQNFIIGLLNVNKLIKGALLKPIY